MTKEQLHANILKCYEDFFFSNYAATNESFEACDAWLEKNAPDLEDIKVEDPRGN